MRNWETVGKKIMGHMRAGTRPHLTVYLVWGALYLFVSE